MKSNFWMVPACGLAIAIIISPLVHGCASKNPAYTPILPGQPQTNTVPAYIPDPRITQYSNVVSSVAGAVAPANPYAGITDWAVNGIFGALGLISLYVARQKSGALSGMAAAVVQSGAHPAVIDAAGNSPHFAAIASAINDNVSSNSSLINQPPKV